MGRGKKITGKDSFFERKPYCQIIDLFVEIKNTPLSFIEIRYLLLAESGISTQFQRILQCKSIPSISLSYPKHKIKNPDNIFTTQKGEKLDPIAFLNIRNSNQKLYNSKGTPINTEGLKKLIFTLKMENIIEGHKDVSGRKEIYNLAKNVYALRGTGISKRGRDILINKINLYSSDEIWWSGGGLFLFDKTNPKKNWDEISNSLEYREFIKIVKKIWIGNILEPFIDEYISILRVYVEKPPAVNSDTVSDRGLCHFDGGRSLDSKLSSKDLLFLDVTQKKGFPLGFLINTIKEWLSAQRVEEKDFNNQIQKLKNLGKDSEEIRKGMHPLITEMQQDAELYMTESEKALDKFLNEITLLDWYELDEKKIKRIRPKTQKIRKRKSGFVYTMVNLIACLGREEEDYINLIHNLRKENRMTEMESEWLIMWIKMNEWFEKSTLSSFLKSKPPLLGIDTEHIKLRHIPNSV